MNNAMCTLVNVYTPNIKQVPFLNKRLKNIDSCHQGFSILGGDFNSVSDPTLDSSATPKIDPVLLIIFCINTTCLMCGVASTIQKWLLLLLYGSLYIFSYRFVPDWQMGPPTCHLNHDLNQASITSTFSNSS